MSGTMLLVCLAAIAAISPIVTAASTEIDDPITILQGSYSIPGPNISVASSTSSPEDRTVDGWSWSIVVAADLPLENASFTHEHDDQGPFYYTGGNMTFNGFPSLIDAESNPTVDDDWEICVR
ncbi:hypothetical protein F5Y09DRAFT_346407 [Xylaria sp. FL1042]|nr:hypothetical protein F5Y09DRAFT_346407 [Xylaria sp. FL1042]